MISQNFIQCDENSLFSIIKYPDNKKATNVVLLIPGFGESSCDVDYFMSDLADYFVENNFVSLQLDLFAHGDSYGKFEDLNSNIIIKNLQNIIEYLNSKFNGKIYVVSRGIYLEYLYERNILESINGIVGISPIKLNTIELDAIEEVLISQRTSIIEFNEFNNKKIISKILIMLGAEPDNLMARRIAMDFLQDILLRLRNKKWNDISYDNIVWITANINTLNINIEYKYSNIQYKTLDYYEGYAFPRDIYWQHNFTKNIIANIIRMSKGRSYENTFSV